MFRVAIVLSSILLATSIFAETLDERRVAIDPSTGRATLSDALLPTVRRADGGLEIDARDAGPIVIPSLSASTTLRIYGDDIAITGELTAPTIRIEARNTLTVRGTAVLRARDGMRGGSITLTGRDVRVLSDATVDASGVMGGGTVLVGGDYQGLNRDVRNATDTLIDAGATLRVDAATGNGGRVIVWSDRATRFAGHISAHGGFGANGGFAEVSGKQDLSFAGTADLGAPFGATGTLLLDPKNITIINSGTINTTPAILANDEFTDNPATSVTMTGAALGTALDAANVTLQANNDITIADNITVTTAGRTLSLKAGRSVSIGGAVAITLNNGTFDVHYNDAGAQPGNRDAGAAIFDLQPSASISTSGGNISAVVDTFGGSMIGSMQLFGTLDAGGGDITLVAVGNASNFFGITTTSATIQTTGSGSITLNGTGAAETSNCPGIELLASTVATQNGGITLTGVAQAASGDTNPGVIIDSDCTINTTGDGGISITGTTAATGMNNSGVVIGASIIAGMGTPGALGSLSITGTASQGSGSDCGVFVGNSVVLQTKLGNLTVTGTASSASGGASAVGLRISGGADINSVGGPVSLSGTSAAISSDGLLITSASVSSSSGAVTLTGQSGTGGAGLRILGTAVNSVANFGDVKLASDTIVTDDAGSIASQGNLFVEPLSNGTSIGIGGAPGTLQLDTSFLFSLLDGFSRITIGSATGSGVITTGTGLTFTDPLTLRSPSLGGSLSISDTLSVGSDDLRLEFANGVNQTGPLFCNGLELVGGGAYNVTNPGNNFSLLAGTVTGDISVTNMAAFNVNSVGSSTGLTGATVSLSSEVDLQVQAPLTATTDFVFFATDSINFTSLVSGPGQLIIRPLNAGADIGVGEDASGQLTINAISLSNIADGFSSIVIGHPSGFGLISVAVPNFLDNVTLRTPDPSSFGISIVGPISVDGALTLDSGGPITLESDFVSESQGAFAAAAPVGQGQPVPPSTGPVFINADLIFASNPTGALVLDYDGPTFFEQDFLVVSGTVTLNNIALVTNVNYTVNPGDALLIIDNDQADPVNGTFNGFPQGTQVVLGGSNLTLTYQDNDGNDISFVSNLAPTVNDSTLPLPENSPNGTSAGFVDATDPDLGQTLTFAIIGGNTGGAFAIDPLTGEITVANAAALDFELAPVFALTVEATDDGTPTLTGSGTVTINLSNVNEDPISLGLNGNTVAENAPAGTVVGALITSDPDVGDVLALSLVAGTGDGDNALFAIAGQSLTTAAALDFETKSVYGVRVRATDAGGKFIEQPFTITVTNVNESPVIGSVTFAPQLPKVGEAVVFTVAPTDPESAALQVSYNYGDGTSDSTGVHVYTGPSTYTVTISVSDGTNTSTTTVQVQVTAVPTTTAFPIAALPNPSAPGEEVTFNLILPTGSTATVAWTFGDGGSGTGASVKHTFASVGIYSVTATAGESVSTLLFEVSTPEKRAVRTVIVSINPADINRPVSFEAVTDFAPGELTFDWDFGDGFDTATGLTVQHTYVDPGDYPLLVTAKNAAGAIVGVYTQTTVFVRVGGGVQNIGDEAIGGETTTNPIDKIGQTVVDSRDGIIALRINIDALVGASGRATSDFDVETDFGLSGRGTVKGTRPAFKYETPGIYVATTAVKEKKTQKVKGKARKTIIISNREVGAPPEVIAEPVDREILAGRGSGRFNFNGSGASSRAVASGDDKVMFQGSVELPEGLLIGRGGGSGVGISVGNVVTQMAVDGSGRAKSTNAKIKVDVPARAPFFPKKTGKRFRAKITVEMTGPDLAATGFDTEGVRPDNPNKEVKLQVGLLLGGVSYDLDYSVKLKVSKDGGEASILGGRGGN